jgi:oligopeptide/dipeptide ABC transporter ATP-binding protein
LTSLDASTAASIAELFRELQARLRIAMLFISHDLAAVRRLATRVAVMFAGEIVETGPSAILDDPAHPYTRLLVASAPSATGRSLNLQLVNELDLLPALPHTAGACYYRPRCVQRTEACFREPMLEPVAQAADHLARCHLCRTEPSS